MKFYPYPVGVIPDDPLLPNEMGQVLRETTFPYGPMVDGGIFKTYLVDP